MQLGRHEAAAAEGAGAGVRPRRHNGRMTTPRLQRIVVAINPSASFGKGRAVGPAVVQTLRAAGHQVQAITEPSWDDLLGQARLAVAGSPDAFVIVGGDGMVNLAANLLAMTRIPLGIVPSGTGNDMSRTLGIPVGDTEAAVRLLLDALQRPPRTIDLGRATPDGAEPRWFACSLSAGFDAVVNERANGMRHPRGPSRYNLAMLIELAVLKPIVYRLSFDGVVHDETGTLVTVGNGRSIGGGMMVTPDAELDDGLFDVMVVRRLTRIQFLRLFPSVFKGTHLGDPRVAIHRAKTVRIEAAGVVAYADGERLGAMPVDIEIVPGALRVLA